ncbi:hypothetical protein MTR_7g035425 [Medicago truncatula]|uniref:Transposase, Ptta/En/Spm, plant n=1 Tax=Medicago truncatula TaxID=3880 RepID=A0A072TXP3_MEDTR|nr:hypothetical protein MTR_7g035425 [Medicago truncatula]
MQERDLPKSIQPCNKKKFIPLPTQNDPDSSTVQTPPTYCAPFPTYPLPPRPAQTHPSYPTQPLCPSPSQPIYISTPFPTRSTSAINSHSPNYRSHVPTQNPSLTTLTQPLGLSPTPPIYITTPFPTPSTPTVHSHSSNYPSHVPTQNPSFPTYTQPLLPSRTPPIYITTPFPTPTTSAVYSHSPNFGQRPFIPGPRSNTPGEFMNLLSPQPAATFVAKYIRLAIQTNFKQFWKTYKAVDKKLIFEWFQTKCVWKSPHDAHVKKNFHYRARHRFQDMMSTVRAKHARDPEWVPGWIGVNIWPRLLEHWATDPTFLKRSQIEKFNRVSEKGGCLHSGGSASS